MKAMAGIGVPDTQPLIVVHADGRPRCGWATESSPVRVGYHDNEWGIPTRDPTRLFEALSLTIFENGLSWAAVFGRRAGLRAAFRGFVPGAVAAMTPEDVDRLLADRDIIRNRRKIEAAVHNARRVVDGPSFADLVWSHRPRVHHRLRRWSDGRSQSPESVRLATRLKGEGYRLVGPVVLHSFMQSVGVANGHFAGCFRARE